MNRNHIRGSRKRFARATAWGAHVGVVALAAVLVAGCSSSTGSTAAHSPSGSPAAVVQPAAHGVEAAIETIPWSQVGPGWMLALWSPVVGHQPGTKPAPNEPARDEVTTTLYLVDPVGGRYPITTFPPGYTARLLDWSNDGSHALFRAAKAGSVNDDTAISVDLRDGKQTTLSVVDGGPIGYARPDGTAVLIGKGHYPDRPSLQRVDLVGNQELMYPVGPDYKGGALPTPDGAQVVLGSTKGLALMGSDGTPGKALPVPGKLSACSPVRWWTSKVVLARCTDGTPLFLDGSALASARRRRDTDRAHRRQFRSGRRSRIQGRLRRRRRVAIAERHVPSVHRRVRHRVPVPPDPRRAHHEGERAGPVRQCDRQRRERRQAGARCEGRLRSRHLAGGLRPGGQRLHHSARADCQRRQRHRGDRLPGSEVTGCRPRPT